MPSFRLLASVLSLYLTISTIARPNNLDTPLRKPWPAQYKISWNFTVPYVSEYQPEGLVYQYEALQDWTNARQRITRDGVETVIILGNHDRMYEIFPAQDTYKCWKENASRPDGPTRKKTKRRSLAMVDQNNAVLDGHHGATDPRKYLGFVLPDLTEDRWEYKGMVIMEDNATQALLWEWDLSKGVMDMRYRFYAKDSFIANDKSLIPLELHMIGVNLYTGGHKDIYIAKYYDYQMMENDDGFAKHAFHPPSNVHCEDAGGSTSLFHQFMQHLPSTHYSIDGRYIEYDVFMHQHGRRHHSTTEYETRLGHYLQNKQFVEEWNRKRVEIDGRARNLKETGHRRHVVALNRFADWSRTEYLSILGRKHSTSTDNNTTVLNHSNVDFLPATVSWKGTEVDGPVKDQAACGSCYAFSAVAALESAVYRSTEDQILLSEQFLMDCGSWIDEPTGSNAANTGCFGGDQKSAIQWVLAQGGLAPASSYPYKGINDFCRASNTTLRVPIQGRMVIVQGGELAVMQALLYQGPMAVSVDADADAFRFYQSGVYYNPECAMTAEELNHAVILSGYGVDIDGETNPVPFWLVKNEWSKYWGEEGYIRIARQPNDCGIAAEAIYVETP